MPFTNETAKIAGLLVLMVSIFFFVELPFHPLVNIVVKSILIIAVYVGLLYRFKISEDVFGVLSGFLSRKTK